MSRVVPLSLAVLLAGLAVLDAQQGGPLTVLATNAIREPLEATASEFKREARREVTLAFETSVNIGKRVQSGAVAGTDVVVATPATVDELLAAGKGIAASRVVVGKVPVGVAIRRGATAPNVATAESLRAAIASADALLFTQGASGAHFERVVKELGLTEATKGKAKQFPTGDVMLEALAASTGNVIGFTQLSEIKRSEGHLAVRLVGPVPASFKTHTEFHAVVLSAASSRDAATAFVRSLVSPTTRQRLSATGWEY